MPETSSSPSRPPADCNDTLREIDTFLDDELSDETRAAIHGHLEGCHDCLEAFDFQAELKQVVARKCATDEMPAGLMSKIANCFSDILPNDGPAPA